jgi:hypothetical protein
MDGPGKNGLAEIFGTGYGADWGQIIVGARFQALNDILLGLFRGEQDQAGVGLVLSGAQFAAYFSAVKTSSVKQQMNSFSLERTGRLRACPRVARLGQTNRARHRER